MTAQIIAVGSELLTPTKIDTNSLFLTEHLNAVGIEVRAKTIVGDSRDDLSVVFRQALAAADLVVLTGGLGPTDDDVTREVVAAALDRPLHEDPALLERLRGRFAKRGLDMPAINHRQAMVPEGAVILPNPNGTAPGLLLEHDDRLVVLLPGPPRELQPMALALVAERLEPRAGRTRLFTGVLRVTGLTESHAEQVAKPFYERWRAEALAIDATTLASPGSIDFHLTVRAADAATGQQRVSHALRELREAFGEDAYSDDGSPLEVVVGALLAGRGFRVAAAESCTGGLLTARLTDVPGSSAWLDRSVVVYSNRSKTDLLGVPESLIEAHGAVSEPVAAAMAAGIRARAGVDIGIGITGIAGPGGGTAEKPVGTVAIAVEGPWGGRVSTRVFPGGRELVRFFASQAALDEVRRALLRTAAPRSAPASQSG